ncbi:hypothetical protein [Caenimonas koreensis]|uniref:Uncharacterized protein n=1 Tax=Caenimonas koreensis DSM 17982 TaxID=1121255 RepID=A0A844AXU2_9BURK|nr:hypothetical protein [Caenimonas koreensis]MRD49185.1 hypothetical protein [Caenimonas koreensis DSM 17982]
MQIVLVGGDYTAATPSFYDPGQGGGGLDMGWAFDFVMEDWSSSAELYTGDGWAGNFSVVDPVHAPGDSDVVTAGLGSRLLEGVAAGLITEGVKVYWNFLIKDGAPSNENGVNWDLSPFFTQGA